MKKPLITTLAILAITTVPLYGQPRDAKNEPIAAAVIVDTSWPGGDKMPNYRTLGLQAAAALDPRDYIEFISAQSGRPRLRLAQTMKSGSPAEMKGISSTLADIRDMFLADARISNALEMALHRLDNTCSKQKYKGAIVIVLSDGELTDGDARRVLQLSEEFRKKAWPLYVTGSRKTNNKLLVAAHQGKLRWSLTSEAQPAIWVQTLKESLRPKPVNPQPPTLPEGKKPIAIDEPKKQIPSDKQKTNIEGHKDSVKEAERSAAVPDPNKADLQSDESRAAEYSLRTTVDLAFKQSRLPRRPVDANESKASIDTKVAQVVLEEPNQSAESTELKKPVKEDTVPEPQLSAPSQTESTRTRLWPWLAAASIFPLALLGYILVHGNHQAKQARIQAKERLKDSHRTNDDVLVAKVNGQTHHLGKLGQLPIIHIGSGMNNTIRIAEKGVNDCHIRIYRKGLNPMIQNIGTKPITANSLELKPRAKQRLILPAVIELTENTKLTLSVLRPKNTVATERSKDHAQNKQT